MTINPLVQPLRHEPNIDKIDLLAQIINGMRFIIVYHRGQRALIGWHQRYPKLDGSVSSVRLTEVMAGILGLEVIPYQ